MTRKTLTTLLIKLALSMAILGVLVSRMDGDSIRDMVHHFSPLAWLAAGALVLLQFGLISYCWMILLNIGQTRMNYRQAAETGSRPHNSG